VGAFDSVGIPETLRLERVEDQYLPCTQRAIRLEEAGP